MRLVRCINFSVSLPTDILMSSTDIDQGINVLHFGDILKLHNRRTEGLGV